MSSAINHKKRSRRGYKMQRTYLAPSNSPMISTDKKERRKTFREFMAKLFRRMNNRTEALQNLCGSGTARVQLHFPHEE